MSEEKEKLCHECELHPATIFINDHQTGSKSLCQDCAATSSPQIIDFLTQTKEAKCDYCGSSPCSASSNHLLNPGSREAPTQWLCHSCSGEYHPKLLEYLSHCPDSFPQNEQLELLKEIAQEMHLHMKNFVRSRDN